MRMQFSKLVTATLAGISSMTAMAHPGHSPADVAAQVSQPFAGADHFVAFVALTAVLLLASRALAKRRAAHKEKARP